MTYAYAAENLPRRWYIGEEHTKIKTYRLWMISQYRKNPKAICYEKAFGFMKTTRWLLRQPLNITAGDRYEI